MTAEAAMLTLWGVLTVGFLALLAYTATLTRYEDDQLFLSGHDRDREVFQQKLVRNVQRAEPMLRVFGGASVLLGTLLVAMYTWQAWVYLQS
ncbi:hypothetical protein SAMN05421771_4095 [Granulicella pectinivorans]|jgi:hypothetical protein|uniref:Uncharacterized protein n=1 Tax=Granulicella pectinivorans TaxID=474950 RepID=A0A1I6MZV0_9BACT|nr:hypothetical protein [Granulicella pectinivorans]SFS21219.1 hypothetical protein SAMN05421771_4095 [Granulicella pectinivorans]